MAEGRPVMMKLPPKITFYTNNRVYEGFGSVNKPAVFIGVGLTLALAGIMSYGLMRATQLTMIAGKTSPLPSTFSEDKQKAQAAKSATRRADPIHDHVVGQKI